MAKVTFTHFASIFSLTPGTTQHWKWNNAPDERVWAFSADPIIPLFPPPFPSTARVEITRVEYRDLYKGGTNFEREVHFWIKNTGNVTADCLVHFSTVRQ